MTKVPHFRLLSSLVLSMSLLMPLSINAETILIENAKVFTMSSQGVLEDVDLLIENGLIKSVAKNISTKADITIDGQGKIVTPGIFAVANQLGLVEIDALDQTGDMSLGEEEEAGASFSVYKAFNPNSTLIPHNRMNGITRALIKPYNSNNIFAGQGSIMSLSGHYNALIRKDVAIFAVYGEYGADLAGGSRANALHLMQKAMQQAKEYQENREAILLGEYRELDFSLEDLEALQGIINKQVPLVINVNRASDIVTMIDFAAENDINVIFSGAAEAWKVAKQIAAAKIPVMLDPSDNIPSSFESLNKRFENAGLLDKAGVEVIFLGQSFQATHNAHTVRQSAGTAVAYGMPYDKALKAITVTPARVFGGASNYGKLIPGYKAELVIWDGDPLEVTSGADQVVIDGKLVDMTSRATKLRDRYKDISNDKNTAYRK